MNESMKTCIKCFVEKPFTAFYKGSCKDGFSGICKICTLEYRKLYYGDNREKVIKTSNAWKAKNRERVLENKKKWYREHSEHVKKQVTTRLAIPENRKKHNKSQLKWAHSNFDKRKDRDLRSKYKISLDEYNSKLEAQMGVCAICADPPKEDLMLAVDHNHATGKVRGLLCGPCNRGLGQFKEDKTILNKVIGYLDLHEKEV